MIVGVTGYFASGKDTVAQYLVEQKGFLHLSLSDIIRGQLRKEGREITIPALTEKGNAMRREKGPGALAEIAVAAMAPESNTVVTSIRHPAEVEALRKAGQFRLLFVDAPIEVRYRRSVARSRQGDCQSFEEFRGSEEAQRATRDSSAQRLDECREMADAVVENDSTLEALYQAIDDFVEQYFPSCAEME